MIPERLISFFVSSLLRRRRSHVSLLLTKFAIGLITEVVNVRGLILLLPPPPPRSPIIGQCP